ncbi:unnamed protein product [Ectocarpus sp. 12 AP-2014]
MDNGRRGEEERSNMHVVPSEQNISPKYCTLRVFASNNDAREVRKHIHHQTCYCNADRSARRTFMMIGIPKSRCETATDGRRMVRRGTTFRNSDLHLCRLLSGVGGLF